MASIGLLVRPQRWKLYVGVFGLAMAGIALLFDVALANAFSTSRYAPILFGALVGALSFLWLAVAIRCPHCGLQVFFALGIAEMGWLAWPGYFCGQMSW